MKHLWLLRHAKSSWDDPSLADHDRPLANRGVKASGRIGRWAARNRVAPDLVLCSSALRARATLELVAQAVELPAAVIERRLYLASAPELLRRIGKIDDAVDNAMVVAHNPGLHDLVALLAPPGPEELPTGALVGIALDVARWREAARGSGRLEEFVIPRSLTD